MTVIFEDDARLFESASASFCSIGIDSRSQELWSNLPGDALLAFLGGHSWNHEDGDKAIGDTKSLRISSERSNSSYKYKAMDSSFGTYGLAIPRHSMDLLIRVVEEDIVLGFRDANNVHQQTEPE
eukprot:875655_1